MRWRDHGCTLCELAPDGTCRSVGARGFYSVCKEMETPVAILGKDGNNDDPKPLLSLNQTIGSEDGTLNIEVDLNRTLISTVVQNVVENVLLKLQAYKV